MEEQTRAVRSRPQSLPVVLLAIFIGAIAFFFLDDRFKSDYATITALLAIPASFGGMMAYLTGVGHRTGGLGCFVWPTIGLMALIAIAWAFAGEGAVCIAMILPLWIPAAIAGYAVSWWNTKYHIDNHEDGVRLNGVGWFVLPLAIFAAEKINPARWQPYSVSREVVVNATPEQIWPLLVSIPEISDDEGQSNFAQDILGIPRPKHATLVMREGALVRKAEWGDAIRFEERITSIHVNRVIAWQFAFPDRSIERSIDRHVSPQGEMLRIENGRYELTRLSKQKTTVKLTTDYTMRTRMPWYLAWWGQRMLGDIQDNVLAIIKDRAEI